MLVRYPAVAGRFYSDNVNELQSMISHWQKQDDHLPNPIKAIIVPHAGYIFSGEVAAKVIQSLPKQSQGIKRVILLGPSHHYYFDGCAIPKNQYFMTPFGELSLDHPWQKEFSLLDNVVVSDEIHAPEHSLEVELPILQYYLNDFTILPILTSNISAENLAKLIDPLWRDDTLLLISSDLSHYHPYQEANQLDLETCEQIEKFHPIITHEQACGATAINSLLLLANQRGYQIQRSSLINSGDTEFGDKKSVVGYASYIIYSIK